MKNRAVAAPSDEASNAYRILVAVGNHQDLDALLYTAHRIAEDQVESEIRVLTITRSGNPPSWFSVPEAYQDTSVTLVTRAGKNPGSLILNEAKAYNPAILILGLSGPLHYGRYLLGRTLDPVIQGATCDVLVQRGELDPDCRRVLIPAAGGPNAPRALTLARRLVPEAEITALYVADERLGKAEVREGQARLELMLEQLDAEDREAVETRVVQAASPIEGILGEAQRGCGLVILGAGNEGPIDRFLFGDIPQVILSECSTPVIVVRRRLTTIDSFWRKLWKQVFGLVPTLTVEEQAEIQRTTRTGSKPTADFLIMLTLAAALAALGLLMDSPAIIIGAMIVAPLMTAILGMGLSIVLGDARFFWMATATTVRGIVLAILTGFLVGQLVPISEPTGEILLRAQPSLLDLAVALTAGVAAAYAISRK